MTTIDRHTTAAGPTVDTRASRHAAGARLMAPARSIRARRSRDRLATWLIWAAFLPAVVPLVSLIAMVVSHGLARLDPAFFTESMRGIIGAGGGALHAIVGTLLVTGVAAAISVPIGLAAAIHLVEHAGGRWAACVRFFVDVMAGIPSIVAGLFVFALFALATGDPGVRSGLAGAVALSVLMLPVVIRSAEEVLRLVPGEVRESALALGVPRWRAMLGVVLPAARSGLVTAVLLAVARVVGETAPLLLVAGYTTSMNYDVASGRMMTLPVFVYTQYAQAAGAHAADAIDLAWTGALVLMAIVLAVNLAGRLVARGLRTRPRTRTRP